jgi:hypothetical protein
MRKIILGLILFSCVGDIHAQKITLKQLVFSESVVAVTGFVALNSLWYKDYPRTSFHFFNDNKQWLQQDKLGHLFTSFHLQKNQTAALRNAGLSDEKARLWSAISVSGVMLGIEVLDGFSAQWGASFGDILANTTGVLLSCYSDLYGNQFQVKFSYSKSSFTSHRPSVLGSGYESILKDYNGQTYWLTISPKQWNFPITLSAGHSVDGLLGGSNNPVFNEAEELLPSFNRSRQWVLSLDVNHHFFKSDKKWVKSLLWISHIIKIPAPAIYFTGGKLKASWLYF